MDRSDEVGNTCSYLFVCFLFIILYCFKSSELFVIPSILDLELSRVGCCPWSYPGPDSLLLSLSLSCPFALFLKYPYSKF